ncbi:MAG: O-antigen ligase family protein [Muribaculaceae bacterium]|nr:O-antigen ligase family protein [Muribaculaceae bacterium]
MGQNTQTNPLSGKSLVVNILCAAVLAVALWQCLLGWAQLFGLAHSLHSRYPATGSFFNPGPYCGFLAMAMPLAMHAALRCRARAVSWIATAYLLLAIGIMPVLMGRTGWIAAAAGCLAVAFGTGCLCRPGRKAVIAWSLLTVAALACAYYLKPASAIGRLFLWRTELSACAESPLTGVGWNHVAGAIGKAQEAYFTARPDSSFSEVAGSPEYAFNEFLQIGIAFGLPAAALFMGLLIWGGVSSWLAARYGIAGSIIAFGIVCFSSYPLQFSLFMGSAAALVISGILAGMSRKRLLPLAVCVVTALTAAAAIITTERRGSQVRQWNSMRYAYVHKLAPRDIRTLDSIAGTLGWNHNFLFDYGKALRNSRMYAKSDSILLRGVEVSSDPMFLNLLGRNSQDTGNPAQAKQWFIRASNRLPSRLYPHYLLAKLHAAPASFDSAAFERECSVALSLEPKVKSPATADMRRHLTEMRDSIRSLRRLLDSGSSISGGL